MIPKWGAPKQTVIILTNVRRRTQFMLVFTNDISMCTGAAGKFPYKPIVLSSRVLRDTRLITAASVTVMAECTILTADATELRREGMKLPPCAKPPLTVVYSSAKASHPRRNERLMWITTRSLPCSFLMTRGETSVVIQPPVLCRTVKNVFLRTPRRTIYYFM